MRKKDRLPGLSGLQGQTKPTETGGLNILGNLTYCNPTRLHFGEQALEQLAGELKNCGSRVLLAYGGGSIKKTGLYDKVIAILKTCGKEVFEVPGVMPNPTVEKLYEGCRWPGKTMWT